MLRIFALTLLLILVIIIILAVGPYLPHPKRWPALANKPSITYQAKSEKNKISVIIPTYNDGADMLASVVSSTLKAAKSPELLQIIIVDGGSKDNYIDVVKKFKHAIIKTSSVGGRGPAINAGIKLATGEIILMLHADCLLAQGFDESLRLAFADPNVLLTAFEFYANSEEYPFLKSVERRVSARSKYLWLPYGDQALAIRAVDLKNLFEGQIPNYKMMEDFELVWKIRNVALDNNKIIAILPQKVFSSPRRFLAKGPAYTAILNWFFVTTYVWFGVPPDDIFKWYYA